MNDSGSKRFVLSGAIVLLLALIAGPRSLMAQQYFGAINGAVTDPSGAAVPQVAITITNTQTGITRQTKTDQLGNYTVGSLVPGNYSVKAEITGFQTTEVKSVDLTVASTLTVNLGVKMGTMTETVEVQAVAPLLNASNATVGTAINNQSVIEMPLNGRNYTDLLLLIPGSVGNGSIFAAGGGQNYSISGNRSEQNNFTLDGVGNNEEFFKQFAIQPSIDAIQEFTVKTNITSAEFGEAAGANVAVATKSGTNQLHGTAYEFLRNNALNASQFFDNRAGNPKTPLKENQFGGTIGGPIYIPHLYDGHDKAFWFFNYEGLRVRQASTQLGTIPTTAQLGGDLRDQNPIFDPTTGKQIQCNGVLNVICTNRIDPFVAAYTALWYPATSTLATAANPHNIVVTSPFQLNQYQVNARVDKKIKDTMQFFARFTDQHASQISPYALPKNFNTLVNSYVNTMASLTWLASPTTVVDLKSSFNRTNIFTFDNNLAPGWVSFSQAHPLQGFPVQSSNFPLYPQLYVGGYNQPNNSGNPFLTNKWQELGSVAKVRGRHSIKVGFEFDHMQGWTDGLFTSQVTFDQGPTANPNPALAANTGSSLASYLLGLPSNGTRNVGVTAAYMRQTTQAYYVQDDFKMRPNLTLNLGLRYEYDQWPHEVHNHLSEFDFVSAKFVWAGPNPLLGVPSNISDPSEMRPDYNNFSPRVGLAYRWNDKTTIRSGFGVFYGANYYWEGQGARGSWPYAIAQSFGGTNTPGSVLAPLENYYPAYNFPVPGTPANAQHTMGRNNRTPYSMQWNIGVQRELARDLMLEVDYVGDGGRKLPLFTNVNDPLPGPGAVGLAGHLRPYQYADPLAGSLATCPPGPACGFGADSQMANEATSNYNGLQVKLEKHFSSGVQFLVSYAWSHYIDIGGSGFSQSAAPQNDQNFGADRANGTFDVRHNFTANWVYDLPVGYGRRFLKNSNKVANGVLGGWELTGIAHFNTGQPLNININHDAANVGQRSNSERPNYVGGPQNTQPLAGDRTQGWLNKSAFAEPALYTYGSLGRNTARNPGFGNFDLGLYKNFAIRENKESIQFRAEFFNAFNHTNLGGIDGTFEDSGFGSIGGTANSARQIQFALKIYF